MLRFAAFPAFADVGFCRAAGFGLDFVRAFAFGFALARLAALDFAFGLAFLPFFLFVPFVPFLTPSRECRMMAFRLGFPDFFFVDGLFFFMVVRLSVPS